MPYTHRLLFFLPKCMQGGQYVGIASKTKDACLADSLLSSTGCHISAVNIAE